VQARGLVPLENTFILTNAAQIEATIAAVPFLPRQNIIAEPAKRDTAPACALATAIARALDPESICAVLPADAMIHDSAKFRACLGDAVEIAAATGAIATIGIPPSFPATGYGYLETAEALPQGSGEFDPVPSGDLSRSLSWKRPSNTSLPGIFCGMPVFSFGALRLSSMKPADNCLPRGFY
jgi:mannose-1-phosphate guanylyltransferase